MLLAAITVSSMRYYFISNYAVSTLKMKYTNHWRSFLKSSNHFVTSSNPIQRNNVLTNSDVKKNHNNDWCKFLQNCDQLVSTSNVWYIFVIFTKLFVFIIYLHHVYVLYNLISCQAPSTRTIMLPSQSRLKAL